MTLKGTCQICRTSGVDVDDYANLRLCSGCADAYTASCTVCGDWYDTAILRPSPHELYGDGDWICESCLSGKIVQCVHCGKANAARKMFSVYPNGETK